jgi:hypothetical protein
MQNGAFSAQNVTLGISLLALAVAVAALVLAWRIAVRDKAKLGLRCEYLPLPGLGVGFKLEITNSGRRLVTIEDVRLIDHRGVAFPYRSLSTKPVQFYFTLPYTLEESEQVALFFPIWHLPSASRDPRDYRKILVLDSSGVRWSISLTNLTRGIGDKETFKDRSERTQGS